MPRPLRLFSAVVLYGMLTACAGAPPVETVSSSAPQTDSIAVPTTDGPLGNRLRTSLTQAGWRLVDYDTGTLAVNRDYATLARRAVYRLTLSNERIGNCRDGSPSFRYNVAVIDNQAGEVAMALTGADCLAAIVSEFEAGLRRSGLVASTIGSGG